MVRTAVQDDDYDPWDDIIRATVEAEIAEAQYEAGNVRSSVEPLLNGDIEAHDFLMDHDPTLGDTCDCIDCLIPRVRQELEFRQLQRTLQHDYDTQCPCHTCIDFRSIQDKYK